MVVIFIDKNTDNGFGYATQQQQQQPPQPSYVNGADFGEEPQSFATHYTAQQYGAPHYHQHQQQQQQQQRFSGPRHFAGSEAHHHHRYLLAERYKTKTCRNHMMTGACPYGHRCMFAHGVHELRTTDMNVRDGLMTEEAIRSFQRAMTAYNRGELAQMMSQDSFVYSSGVAPYAAPMPHSQPHELANASSPATCECANCSAARATHNPYYAAMPPATALGHSSPAPIQQLA